MPPLRRSDLLEDPIAQFRDWFARAEAETPLAEAVCLATADGDGRPDARMVLLKGFDNAGFRFHTNYSSAKARQIESTGHAALVFHWRELDRQVRIRGPVERLPAAESDEYFTTRPRDRQIGAWVSPQSQPLRGREELDAAVTDVTTRFGDGPIPRPGSWGGYLVRPVEIEFWQGQVGRLHDRFLYTARDGGWAIERLAP